ncbi:MAG TPA: DUF6677 family protein [Vicinamibacterales bacterium]
MRATTIERAQGAHPLLVWIAAWLVPGAGHLWTGQRLKGLVFLVMLPAMFAIGLALHGRLFPYELDQPLVALAAIADLGIGLPYLAARVLGVGGGDVIAVTYEYGNTFLIVAGLLNLLVAFDAFDIAAGRKG